MVGVENLWSNVCLQAQIIFIDDSAFLGNSYWT